MIVTPSVYGDILYDKAADGSRKSVNAVLKSGVRTPDLGGKSSTTEAGKAIAKQLQSEG